MNATTNRTKVTGHVRRIGTLSAIAVALFALAAAAQTARDVEGATPLVAIQNEAAPRLIVDPPVAEQLAQGARPCQSRRASDTFTTTWMASRGPSSTRAVKPWCYQPIDQGTVNVTVPRGGQ